MVQHAPNPKNPKPQTLNPKAPNPIEGQNILLFGFERLEESKCVIGFPSFQD